MSAGVPTASANAPVWGRSEALVLCKAIEDFAPEFGAHVALTGGLLYKSGTRKDFDILFYSIRQVEEIDIVGLLKRMKEIGFSDFKGPYRNWLYKAEFDGKPVDLFFPEQPKSDWLGI